MSLRHPEGVENLEFPLPFLAEIESLIGDELNDFLESYDTSRFYGLRVNRLKISVEDFLKISPFKLKAIPWTRDGFYYDETERPAKHPYYHAGLYYLQEPSAMVPVAALAPEPGDIVLDLCACPGGKTLQIASALGGEGLIVANDISTSRIKALIRNLEFAGVKNALVLNENEETLGSRLENFFDRVLVDAPCSGEGMFRKDPKALSAWSVHASEHYRTIQDSLLNQAARLLKSGGQLAYSTCTFSKLEDESALIDFLKSHPEFKRLNLDPELGLDLRTGFGRLWPHLHRGEGHFIGILEKSGNPIDHSFHSTQQITEPPESYRVFEAENLTIKLEGRFMRFKDKIYLAPDSMPETAGLRVIRSGWYLGDEKNGRFVPSGAFAMGLHPSDIKRVFRFGIDQFELMRYLKGETIHVNGEDGLNLVCLGDFPLGWGKLHQNVMKNQYPPAWRMM
jgi:NOL1/NOP2/sun family putative RNA methylase